MSMDVKFDGTSVVYRESADDRGYITYTLDVAWTVKFEGNNIPAAILRPVIAAHAWSEGIPRLYSVHPLDPWLYVYEVTPTQIGIFYYKVVVHYKSINDPLNYGLNPPLVVWESETTQEPIDKDVEDNPIANSAGQPFDPPIQETFRDKVLKIDRNEGSFDHARASEYEGAINSDAFWGFAVGKVQCRKIQAEPKRAAALNYFAVHYEFVIRKDEWKRRIKDQGLASKDSSGNLSLAKDVNGETMTEPVALDGSGGILASGAAPVWLEFDTKSSRPFSVLGLA